MWNITICPRLFKSRSRAEGILSFLEQVFKDEILRLRDIKSLPDNQVLSKNERIWLCWWQGKNDMPPTIKNCIDSICYYHKDCTITILDNNNYSDYVEIPEVIIDKVARRVMTLSQFSDILRCAVLYKHGGIWLDSALFCNSHGEWNGMRFFSPKINIENDSYISGFKWVPGCIGAVPGFPMFGFAYHCFIKYWERYSFLVDFLMVDFIFELAYRNNVLIQEIIDDRSFNNEGIHKSRYLFNDRCDENEFQRLVHENTFLSLTWRFQYHTHTDSGELTYYGRLLQEFENQKMNQNNKN